MAKVMESLATVNSFLRTLLAVVIVGGIAVGSWFGYVYYKTNVVDRNEQAAQLVSVRRDLDQANEELNRVKTELDAKALELEERLQEIAALQEDVKKKAEEIQRLDTSLRLLKVTERIARLRVVDQGPDNDTGNLFTLVDFVELDEQGTEIGEPRQFRIEGDIVYIDTRIVKFEDKYVEQADLERSTSLVLFHRLFGEKQKPEEGFALDEVGSRPQVYSSGDEMTTFEKKIWDDFWSIANNPQRAAELGIRAIHGDAPSYKVKKGMAYKIMLRASDGLSIIPDPDAPPVTPPATGT